MTANKIRKSIFALFALVTLILTLGVVTANLSRPTDYVSYYNFNNGVGSTLYDQNNTNNNDGTISGMSWDDTDYPTYNQSGDGSPYSGSFDGTDDHVDIGDVTETRNGYSFSLWFNANNAGESETVGDMILNAQDSRPNFSLLFYVKDNNLYIRHNSDLGSSSSQLVTSVNSGQWYHVVGMWDGSSNTIVYVDGVKELNTSTQQPGDDTYPTNEWFIGYRGSADTNSNYFDGNIDDVAIYDRTLSSGEVTDIYNNGMDEGINPVTIESVEENNVTRNSAEITTSYNANDETGEQADHIVYYKKTSDSNYQTKTETITSLESSGSDTITIEELEGSTEYDYYTEIITSETTTTSEEKTLNTLQDPSPETLHADQVYLDTARLRGNISYNDYEDSQIAAYYQYREQGEGEWINTTKTLTSINYYTELLTQLPENTTIEYNLCLETAVEDEVICDDENREVKTLERPTITIDDIETVDKDTVNATTTVERNDATGGQPSYEYNIHATFKNQTYDNKTLFENNEETETVTITIQTQELEYGSNEITINEDYWMGDANNNTQESDVWDESQYEAPFQRSTKSNHTIEEPESYFINLDSEQYDEVLWKLLVETSYTTSYKALLLDPETNEEVGVQEGTVDDWTTFDNYYIKGLESNKTYVAEIYANNKLYNNYTVTTQERETHKPYLENNNIVNTNLENITVRDINIYTGDHWGEFDSEITLKNTENENQVVQELETINTNESEIEENVTIEQDGEMITGLEPGTEYEAVVTTKSLQNNEEISSETITTSTEKALNPEIRDGNITDIGALTLTHDSNLTSLGTASSVKPYLQVRKKVNPDNEIIINPNGFDTENGYIKIINETGDQYFLEEGENITEPTTIESQAYQLESDTEYEARMCVESEEWNTKNCTDYDTERTIEQGVEGVKTIKPVRNYDAAITLRGETEHLHDARNVKGWFIIEHMESGNVTNTTKFDIDKAGTHSQRIENLSYETEYEYQFYVEKQLERNGEQVTLESKGGWESFTTNVEKDIENIWTTLLEGDSWAKILVGVAITLSILFVGVTAFGKANMQLGTYGIMILLFTGALLATIIGLFPTYILLLIILGGVVLAILKGMLFNKEGE